MDTQRHRLGPNFEHIPINCPYRVRAMHYERDGLMNPTDNHGREVNYEPNSLGGPVADKTKK